MSLHTHSAAVTSNTLDVVQRPSCSKTCALARAGLQTFSPAGGLSPARAVRRGLTQQFLPYSVLLCSFIETYHSDDVGSPPLPDSEMTFTSLVHPLRSSRKHRPAGCLAPPTHMPCATRYYETSLRHFKLMNFIF